MNFNISDGNTPLEQILAHTELTIRSGEFVLIGLPPNRRSYLEADMPSINNDFFQYIAEPDVLTLLVNTDNWAKLHPHYPEAKVEGPLRVFTFTVAMAWDVVGFLATITNLLAQADIPLGTVCGYYRDHLFISVDHAPRAEAVLRTEIERRRD